MQSATTSASAHPTGNSHIHPDGRVPSALHRWSFSNHSKQPLQQIFQPQTPPLQTLLQAVIEKPGTTIHHTTTPECLTHHIPMAAQLLQGAQKSGAKNNAYHIISFVLQLHSVRLHLHSSLPLNCRLHGS
jgi:hypothetical protein